MHTLLTKDLKQKLSDLGVGVLYLYGSRAQGTARVDSDYDVGIVFTDPANASTDINSYNKLYDVLSDAFPDTRKGPKLDIALLQRANAKLQLDAINHGLVLFESNPRVRADYEESVIKRYDDYQYLQREYDDATFSAFSTPKYV